MIVKVERISEMRLNDMKKYKLSELADIIGGGTPNTSRPDYRGGEIL